MADRYQNECEHMEIYRDDISTPEEWIATEIKGITDIIQYWRADADEFFPTCDHTDAEIAKSILDFAHTDVTQAFA